MPYDHAYNASVKLGRYRQFPVRRILGNLQLLVVKETVGWVAAIAPWFRLRLLSCGPGSNPKHSINVFSICIIKIVIGIRKGQK